jgi:hypothetical protein
VHDVDSSHRGEDERPDGEREPVDLRPYLCIPYWTSPIPGLAEPDSGEERPLPASVLSWVCPAIHASPYTPGERLDVQVDIRNSGAGPGTALATVLVYWADATVGFAKPKLLGSASVAVAARGGTATTKVISGVIPATASNHICLLCAVTHSLDKAGSTPNPIHDRHWAQRNLIAVGAAPGEPTIAPFTVANPTEEAMDFRLDVRLLEFDLLRGLARSLGGEPSDIGLNIRLLDARGTVIGRDLEAGADLALEPQQRLALNLSLEPLSNLEGSQVSAVEAVLLAGGEEAVGSLGFVVRAPHG